MKFCLPVESDNGFDSLVHNHFGTAPSFVIVDTETKSLAVIANADLDHTHGGCNPVRALNNTVVDIVITGGIGSGALKRLLEVGVRVFKAEAKTVLENLNMLADKRLPEFVMQDACAAHDEGGICCPH
ncbi:MAG TPA: NifB/NifX family molybdenum-iron cluster-binding protein [Dissulfurispiraceae bacterium]|nr:NifB/NifX family molybdenum-iron cluster-binding protein [Dissulfurispiraceae bacterium]